MHQLIYGIVYGEDSESAVETASTSIFHPLVHRGEFDYFVTFDEPGQGVAGRDRWGDRPTVSPVDSEDGIELINRGWEATVSEYERSFDRIEEFLDSHDSEAYWQDESVHREYLLDFHRVGQFQGPGVFLYDPDGEGIQNRGHLDRVLDGEIASRDVDDENQELYVVPADVHY